MEMKQQAPVLQQPQPLMEQQLQPALQRLVPLHKIEVKQKPELLEAMTGFETNNQYDICDGGGRPFMKAIENSGVCARMCCGPRRPFSIEILDQNGELVTKVTREYKCLCFGQCCSCFGCCQDCVTVESPPGTIIGYVRQQCGLVRANFTIRDADDNVVLLLRGPCYCLCRCPGQKYKFAMLSPDGSQEIGKLNKEWSGFVKEVYTDADNFLIEVPPAMASTTKMTLIAAVFLIDFMFFESEGKENKVGSRNVAHAIRH